MKTQDLTLDTVVENHQKSRIFQVSEKSPKLTIFDIFDQFLKTLLASLAMLNETFYVIFKHCVKSLKATIGYDNIRMMSRPLKLLLRSAKKLFFCARGDEPT